MKSLGDLLEKLSEKYPDDKDVMAALEMEKGPMEEGLEEEGMESELEIDVDMGPEMGAEEAPEGPMDLASLLGEDLSDEEEEEDELEMPMPKKKGKY